MVLQNKCPVLVTSTGKTYVSIRRCTCQSEATSTKSKRHDERCEQVVNSRLSLSMCSRTLLLSNRNVSFQGSPPPSTHSFLHDETSRASWRRQTRFFQIRQLWTVAGWLQSSWQCWCHHACTREWRQSSWKLTQKTPPRQCQNKVLGDMKWQKQLQACSWWKPLVAIISMYSEVCLSCRSDVKGWVWFDKRAAANITNIYMSHGVQKCTAHLLCLAWTS